MTNTQHTPGPWSYHYERTINRHIVRSGFAGERNICVTYGAGATSYECAANARLIAAAPELLEALEGLLNLEPPLLSAKEKKAYAIARAAIAKATGVQS